MPSTETLLTPSGLSMLSGIHIKQIQKAARNGKIPSVSTLGGQRRYRPEDVVKALRALGQKIPPPLLALVGECDSLAPFTVEQLEEELKRRGRDYRGALERIANRDALLSEIAAIRTTGAPSHDGRKLVDVVADIARSALAGGAP